MSTTTMSRWIPPQRIGGVFGFNSLFGSLSVETQKILAAEFADRGWEIYHIEMVAETERLCNKSD